MQTPTDVLATPEPAVEKSLLAELLEKSRSYHGTQEFRALLDFAVAMRNFAPFNAFLLSLQRPGLPFSASAYDWEKRHGRTIREGAFPLIILWPFGPVALVYDLEDTVGPELPVAVARAYWATGEITARRMGYFAHQLASKGIDAQFISYGDGLTYFAQTTFRDPMEAVRRAVLRSAGQIEGVLQLGGLTSFGPRKPRKRPPLEDIW